MTNSNTRNNTAQQALKLINALGAAMIQPKYAYRSTQKLLKYTRDNSSLRGLVADVFDTRLNSKKAILFNQAARLSVRLGDIVDQNTYTKQQAKAQATTEAPKKEEIKSAHEWTHFYHVMMNTPNKAPKSVYRRLCRQWHPDVNKAKNAEATFKELGKAWDQVQWRCDKDGRDVKAA